MSFFDNLSKKLSDAGNAAIAKTKEIADVAKLNSGISAEERKIRDAITEIGKAYVEKYGETAEEPFASNITVINEAKAKIEELKAEIEAVKNANKAEGAEETAEAGNIEEESVQEESAAEEK